MVWSVNPNSNRTGIRLEGGTFEWARRSGGIAGGHPSNILDNGYPVGAVNINGDLPVILCTGHIDPIAQRELESAGIRGLLHKPVEPDELYGLLKAHLH